MHQSMMKSRTDNTWYVMGAVDAYYGRHRIKLEDHPKDAQQAYDRGYDEKAYGEKVDSDYE